MPKLLVSWLEEKETKHAPSHALPATPLWNSIFQNLEDLDFTAGPSQRMDATSAWVEPVERSVWLPVEAGESVRVGRHRCYSEATP